MERVSERLTCDAEVEGVPSDGRREKLYMWTPAVRHSLAQPCQPIRRPGGELWPAPPDIQTDADWEDWSWFSLSQHNRTRLEAETQAEKENTQQHKHNISKHKMDVRSHSLYVVYVREHYPAYYTATSWRKKQIHTKYYFNDYWFKSVFISFAKEQRKLCGLLKISITL